MIHAHERACEYGSLRVTVGFSAGKYILWCCAICAAYLNYIYMPSPGVAVGEREQYKMEFLPWDYRSGCLAKWGWMSKLYCTHTIRTHRQCRILVLWSLDSNFNQCVCARATYISSLECFVSCVNCPVYHSFGAKLCGTSSDHGSVNTLP